MMLLNITLFILFVFLINFTFKKKKMISNYSGNNHQMFSNQKNIPLSGGLFLFIGLLLLFYDDENIKLFLIIFSIFVIGFFSDLKILSSPIKRFLFK